MSKLWMVEVNLMDLDGNLVNCFHVAEMDSSIRTNIDFMIKTAQDKMRRRDHQEAKWVPVGYADNIEEALDFVKKYRFIIEAERKKRGKNVE